MEKKYVFRKDAQRFWETVTVAAVFAMMIFVPNEFTFKTVAIELGLASVAGLGAFLLNKFGR